MSNFANGVTVTVAPLSCFIAKSPIYCVYKGVESAEQVAELQELRCGLAQGYFFARPMPEEDLARGCWGSK